MGNAFASLKKKQAGLPLYVWALIVAVIAFYLYRRHKANTATAIPATAVDPNASTTAVDPSTQLQGSSGDSGSGGGSSGGGPASDITNPNPFDNTSPYYVYSGAVDNSSNPPPNSSADNSQLGSTAPNKVPLQAGLNWGGQIFGSQAAFTSWLNSHGGNLNDFAKNHPAAFQQLQGLPQGTHPSESVNNNPASSSKSSSIKINIPQTISGSIKLPTGSPLASSHVNAPSKVVKIAPPSGYDPKSKANLH